MKAAELRQSILQAAVRGKLVPQNPHDEPASELLQHIQQEKAQLVKAGKLKHEKLLPPVTEDEIPYDLPEGWTWCRVGEIAHQVTSGSREWAKYYSTSGAKFIRMGNLSKNHYRLKMINVQYVSPPDNVGEGKRTSLQENDILVSITGDVGLLGLVPSNFGEAYINQHVALVRCSPIMFPIFVVNAFLSPLCVNQFNAPQRGIKNSFRLTDLLYMLIPVPPRAEQARIVAKLGELMALCDALEAEEKRLDALEEHLAEHLPKAILQAAVQGKLVPQNSHDEPASELLKHIQQKKARLVKEGKLKKEKPLLPISEDEIPYDLPEGWVWCRLGEITNIIMGQSPKGDSVLAGGDGIEFHQGKTSFTDKYLALSTQKTNAPTKIATVNSVLLSVRAPVGAVNITERDICIGRGLCAFNSLGSMSSHFLFYFLKSMEQSFIEQATGTTFIAVTGEVVKNQLFPLPPLAEQQRIIAKIDELMALCEEMKVAYIVPTPLSKPDNIIPFPVVKTEEETLLAARGDVGQLSNEAMQAIDDLFAEDEE